MKKITFLIILIILLHQLILAQGVVVPGGTGAHGNTVYVGGTFLSSQPYSHKSDAILSFGIGFGDPIEGLGFQFGSPQLDVSQNDLYNAGIKVHRYLGKGIYAAIGIENLMTFGSGKIETPATEYIAITQKLSQLKTNNRYLSKISYCVGIGLGRFSRLNVQDAIEHNRTKGSYVFAGVQYALDRNLSLHCDWSGTNMNASISLNASILRIPFSLNFAALDLTRYSGNKTRLMIGGGFVYGFTDNRKVEKTKLMKTILQNQEREMLNSIISGSLKKERANVKDTAMLIQIQKLKAELEKSEADKAVLLKLIKGKTSESDTSIYNNQNIKTISYITDNQTDKKSGYYVVIYSFQKPDQAENMLNVMKNEKKIDCKLIYNKDKLQYYLCYDHYENLKEAIEKSCQLHNNGFYGAWVYIY